MTFVVNESCIKCKYTDCVSTCPVDAFHEADNFLVINPEDCIDCNACVPECPAEAILAGDDVPPEKDYLFDLNKDLSDKLPKITVQKDPLPDADLYLYDEKTVDMIKVA